MVQNQICKNYCGLACVSGECPKALRDDYAECGMDVINDCSECGFYKGCEDCALIDYGVCNEMSKFRK